MPLMKTICCAMGAMFTSTAKFTTPIAQMAQARVPLIKFIGARLPRPDFSRVVSGPIPSPPIPPVASAGSVDGTVQKHAGYAISEDELPVRFRRPLIDQEECDAINFEAAWTPPCGHLGNVHILFIKEAVDPMEII
ncbi:hypothetical protein COOONC_27919 [Cooperia oncophora]